MTQPPDQPPPDRPPPGDEHEPRSGVVIVVLEPGVPATAFEDLYELAKGLDLPGLQGLLDALGRPRTARQVTSVEPERILRTEARAAAAGVRVRHSLTRFWRVDLADPTIADAVARRFAALPAVATAYAEVDVLPRRAASSSTALAVAFTQRYLQQAPEGIDVAAVAALTGGQGENTGLVDVETAWRLNHPEIQPQSPEQLCNDNMDGRFGIVGNHGNAVLGIVAAVGAGAAVVGAAPAIRALKVASHAKLGTTLHVTDALAVVNDKVLVPGSGVEPGDVVLLEVARGHWPTEIDYSDFTAIRTAVGLGLVVVAAAGNNALDLDSWSETLPEVGERRMQRGDDRFDSGAIMVGACRQPLLGNGHERDDNSNWGLRVDCYAWGQNVETCKAQGFDPNFTETSAAAAIVAGAAVLAQSVRVGAGGALLTSPDLRAVLALPAHGTPQTWPGGIAETDLIGSMPTLAAVGPAVAHPDPVVMLLC